jgi:flagellar hook-length control protein FliK
MSNGQMNVVAASAVMPMVVTESVASVLTAPNSGQKKEGSFAGLLSGIKHTAKEGVVAKAQQGQAQDGASDISATKESADNNLLAQLQVMPTIIPTVEPVVIKTKDSEETDQPQDKAILQSDTQDATLQIAVSAYSQSGRMPQINKIATTPVDSLQNVAAIPESPPVSSAPANVENVEHTATAPTNGSQILKPVTAQTFLFPADEKIKPLQPGAIEKTAAGMIEMATEVAAVDKKVELPQESSELLSRVNNMTRPQEAKLQNVVETPDASVIAGPETKQQQVQTTTNALESKPEATGVKVSEQQSQEGETATSASSKSPEHVTLSRETELEIQLSQPRQIVLRASAANVSVESRTATLSQIQEVRADRQRLSAGQQNEKSRTVADKVAVKDLAPLQQLAVSTTESTLGTSDSGGGSNPELLDGNSAGNQLQQMDLQGQLNSGHQKVSTVMIKPITVEPARLDTSEHVMQQVKERLAQHEVKSGNQQITLTLSPDSLGELKMNLNLQGQKLSVEIVTENRSVRDVIAQNTDALKESLARQNITMESFDVTTGGKGFGNQGANQNAWREMAKQQQQQQLWASPRGYQTAQADLSANPAAYQQQAGQSMLDIHY